MHEGKAADDDVYPICKVIIVRISVLWWMNNFLVTEEEHVLYKTLVGL